MVNLRRGAARQRCPRLTPDAARQVILWVVRLQRRRVVLLPIGSEARHQSRGGRGIARTRAQRWRIRVAPSSSSGTRNDVTADERHTSRESVSSR